MDASMAFLYYFTSRVYVVAFVSEDEAGRMY
jgi:hypothetical protein